MAYDSPNAQVRRESPFGAGALAASAVISRFLQFQKGRLNTVHVQCRVAGTTTAAAVIVRQGTTALGTYALGTGPIGLNTSIALNTSFTSLTEFNVINGSDLTMQVAGAWEYSVDWDATQS